MEASGVEKALIVQPIIYLYDHSCELSLGPNAPKPKNQG